MPIKQVKKNESLWLMSFSDMSLVLLTFFILIISTMKPDKEKFRHIKDGMTDAAVKPRDTPQKIAEELREVVKDKKLAGVVSIDYDSEGLHVEFNDGLLFAPGSAAVKTATLQTVREVMALVAKVDSAYRLEIEGHTDDVPLRRGNVTNWELSSSRGFSLMREFHSLGVPEERISVLAFAHTRPKVPYQGLQGKALEKARAANRRVVIHLR